MSAERREEVRERLRGLHVLCDDDSRWKWDPVEQAAAACAGGASVVQLRAKHAGDPQMLAWAARIRELATAAGMLFFVNDRFDLALTAAADGVHLGQDDLPPARIPAPLRQRLLVGRSTHTPEQVRRACGEPIDYLAFGPVFGTTSKPSPWTARGSDALVDTVQRASPRPAVAIGGIDAANLGAVAAAGAGAAVISAVAGASDPVAATRELCALLAKRTLP